MIDLCRDKDLLAEVEAAVVRVVRSGQYILGPEVENLERELAAYLGCRQAVTMSSGTDALLAPLMALGVGPGDRVILPTYSFFATAGVVARLGAEPIFVDVEPTHLNLDPQRLRDALTHDPDAKAVIGVHLFGAPFAVEEIVAICKDARVPLIEDAAQAIGSRHGDRMCGAFGQCAAWSTFPTKNFGGLGDGGFLTTDDEELARQIRLLRNHGQAEQYRHTIIGGNFRMDAIQAAALRVKLRAMDDVTATRRANAERYRTLFERAGLQQFATLPVDVPGHAYHQFVIRVEQRDRQPLMQHLREQGIGCAVYYPIPFHEQPCFSGLGHRHGEFPVAERAAATTLALPIFQGLTEGEQIEVVGAIKRYANR